MQAIKDAGIPEDLWPTALPLALADLRSSNGAGSGNTSSPTGTRNNSEGATRSDAPSGAGSTQTKSRKKKRPATSGTTPATPGVLATLGDESTVFKKVCTETDVTEIHLSDIFHIEDGQVHLKIAGKNLGANKKASTTTVAALLGGLLFAGTSHKKLAFKEVNDVCKVKHCHDAANSASYIKATPGFATVGVGASQSLTTKSGWQGSFEDAVKRVLGKDEKPPQ